MNYDETKVKKLKPKRKKRGRNARTNYLSCPNCLSTLKTNEVGILECTGDRLKFWESEFSKFYNLTEEKKIEYLKNVSVGSRFDELYDRWVYVNQSTEKEQFDCGYTNTVFPLHSSSQVRIPDPIFCKRLEKKLGRPLTLEEIVGEEPLYMHRGMVLTNFKKRAKLIRIPFVLLPSEENIYG